MKASNSNGFTMVEMIIVVAVIAALAAVTIPGFIGARKSTNETAAIASMKAIMAAQAIFKEKDHDGDGQFSYAPALLDLGTTGLIDNALSTGVRQGYTFEITAADAFAWACQADPSIPGATGDRGFFVDESGVMRMSTSGSATVADPQVGQ